jgi:hypothetical protein
VTDPVFPKRLNYGCGYDKRDGYLNVDMDPGCEPDVLIVDNDLSPLPELWFEEVLAIDVLEHVPRTQTLSILLEWADLLQDGGKLELKTSSILGVARQLANEPSFRRQYGWVLCLFGNQAHPGDFHLTGFTELTLRVYLLAAGFRVDRVWLTDRWLMHAEATKVASWNHQVVDLADADDDQFVRAVYEYAFRRDPQPAELDHFTSGLATGAFERKQVCQIVWSSPERLFVTAHHHGFESSETASLIESIWSRTPAVLQPPLRALSRTARSGSLRARRALGARRRLRSSF